MKEKIVEISIIIPIYNVEKYLSKCLDSIYSLKLDNKEIILINDGSRDNSFEIAKKYKEKYKENTILINQQNQGLSEARNIGMKKAKGKFILFIDSDDFVDTKVLEIFLNKGLAYNVDILIGNSSSYYDENNIRKDYFSPKLKSLGEMTGKFFLEKRIQKKCFYLGVWRNLYRKNFLLENNLFFEKGLLFEDTLFTPKAFYLAKKVRYTEEYFYYYRQNNLTSITKRKNKNKSQHLLYIIDELINFQNKLCISNKYINRIIINLCYQIIKEEKLKNDDLLKKIEKLDLNLREKLKLVFIKILKLRDKFTRG